MRDRLLNAMIQLEADECIVFTRGKGELCYMNEVNKQDLVDVVESFREYPRGFYSVRIDRVIIEDFDNIEIVKE